jgi:hypothetical protein
MPVLEPRRIVQIASHKDALTALCSDGTVWQWINVGPRGLNMQWLPVPALPQSEVKPETAPAAATSS